jgi:hypothetical protein
MMRALGVARLPLYALAGYRDNKAEQICEKLRLKLADAKLDEQSFQDARAAAAATLANGVSSPVTVPRSHVP